MNSGICAVADCDGNVQTRGWCGMHYKRWLKHGDPTLTAYMSRKPGERCHVEDCDKIVQARQMCTGHYQRWRTGKPVEGPLRARNTPTGGSKICPSCEVSKERSEYSNNGNGRWASWCKECRAIGNKKLQYGLSREDYKALVSIGCSVCGEFKDKMVIDHDHKTGEVRGALCNNCNVALGHAFDNPDILRAMIAYLEH